MLKLALIYSNEEDLQNLKKWINKFNWIKISGEFTGITAALATLGQGDTDLVICDGNKSEEALFGQIMNYRYLPPFIFTGEEEGQFMNYKNTLFFLKQPFSYDGISFALKKYLYLKDYFTKESTALLAEKNKQACNRNNKRLIVTKGCEYILIDHHEIAYIFHQDEKTTVIDLNNNRYLIRESPARLKNIFNTEGFYTDSSHLLLNINAVKSYISDKHEKVEVKFTNSKIEPLALDSKDSDKFKEWINNFQYAESEGE